jgi:hypothetical protein
VDHAEALERIELAAAEPDGLERLMAGDTPDAAAVAGHLAGCESCQGQLVAIRRTAAVARRVIEAEPDPALKERTLAYIREVGRDRSRDAAPAPASPDPVVPFDRPRAPHVPDRGTRLPRWVAYGAVAAAIVLALGAGVAGGIALRPGESAEAFVLRETAQGAVRVGAQPDATKVALAATPAAPGAAGTVLFSGTTGELVMAATGLAAPPDGMEYGCWLEVGGERERIGKLYPGGDILSWVGPVDGLAGIPAGSTFGVSLVPVAGGPGRDVLAGSTPGTS